MVEDGVRRPLGIVRHDLAVAARAVQGRRASPERLRVIGDLRHRADRRAARAHGRLAVHGDGRGHGFERIHRRPLEPLEELPRVGAEALDVASLPLGVERVEGQRALPRPRGPRDHDEGSRREIEIDRAEVVGFRAAQAGLLHGDVRRGRCSEVRFSWETELPNTVPRLKASRLRARRGRRSALPSPPRARGRGRAARRGGRACAP